MSTQHSDIPVRIASGARRTLVEIAQASTGRDGLEVGGVLIGAVHRDLVEVVEVHAPGPRSVRSEHEFRSDPAHDMALIAAAVERSDGQLGEVGHWHTHPVACRAPSPADLSAIAGLRALSGLERAVAVIAVPVAGSWDLEAIVVRPAFSVDRAERARMVSASA